MYVDLQDVVHRCEIAFDVTALLSDTIDCMLFIVVDFLCHTNIQICVENDKEQRMKGTLCLCYFTQPTNSADERQS
jgi:hypothetical protein